MLTYPNGTIRDLLDAKSISWKFYANKVYPYTSQKAGYRAFGAPSTRSKPFGIARNGEPK